MTDQWFHHLQHHHWQGNMEKERLRKHTKAQDNVCKLQWEQACDASSIRVVRDLRFFM